MYPTQVCWIVFDLDSGRGRPFALSANWLPSCEVLEQRSGDGRVVILQIKKGDAGLGQRSITSCRQQFVELTIVADDLDTALFPYLAFPDDDWSFSKRGMQFLMVGADRRDQQVLRLLERQHSVLPRVQVPRPQLGRRECTARDFAVQSAVECAEESLDDSFVGW